MLLILPWICKEEGGLLTGENLKTFLPCQQYSFSEENIISHKIFSSWEMHQDLHSNTLKVLDRFWLVNQRS